jgi:CubicO group peptidase (beta-lactamase class C family)
MQHPSSYSLFSPTGMLKSVLGGGHRERPVRIDTAAECAPEEAGLSRNRVETIWRYVKSLYGTGLHPAITLSLRRHGKVFLQRSIGHAHGYGTAAQEVPQARPDTPICLFSASKAITALLVLKLAEDGKLQLDDPVAHYLPAFAAHGKGRVSIRQLLAHRAGIPSIPFKDVGPELFYQWDKIIAALCAAKPFDPNFEKQAYHAITGGYILGELVQKVGQISLPDALRQWLAEPLGCQYLSFGLAPEYRALAAPNFHTGPRTVWPITAISKRILGATFEDAVEISNTAPFLDSVIPAGNVFASADDACRVFQMMLNGGTYHGQRIFRQETLDDAIKPFGRIQFDGMLMVPIRFSSGFILGERPIGLYGPNCPQAYGHLGFLNILCWADPQRDLAASILTTGKTLAPAAIVHLAALLKAINTLCEDVPTPLGAR